MKAGDFMSNPSKKHIIKTTTILTVIVFVLSLSIFGIIIRDRYEILHEEQLLDVTLKQFDLFDDMNEFINQNVSLAKGFSAYIHMNETYKDKEVYTLLSHLYSDRLHEVRNVTVFKDTTITWVYPLEGNESAIGVDLSKIPEQADDISRLKSDLEILFVGPVNLVQGGQGFIVRIPIIKDDMFWGMTSVVLRAERAFSFLDQQEEFNKVSYLITQKGDIEQIIYGDQNIIDQSPLKFDTNTSLANWDIYAIPKDGWSTYIFELSIHAVVAVIASLGLARIVYKFAKDFNTMRDTRDQFKSDSITDNLTGLKNRDFFDRTVDACIGAMPDTVGHLSVIYMDVDNFKMINDTHGHAIGDYVLKSVAQTLTSAIRDEDTLARWGGDEFIVLLEHANIDRAMIVAKKIRLAIQELQLDHDLNVSVSIGVSERQKNENWDTWFKRVDHALYLSKKTGRNKVSSPDYE